MDGHLSGLFTDRRETEKGFLHHTLPLVNPIGQHMPYGVVDSTCFVIVKSES